MSKIFQIEANVCYWDATRQFPTLESTVGYFPPAVQFVEAPDYVFEGWGYVNGEFIKPTPPDGWLYNEQNGTFYLPENNDMQMYTLQENKESDSIREEIFKIYNELEKLRSEIEKLKQQ